MEIPSKHLQEAVEQLSSLPGIGKKTALRLVLHLMRQNKETVKAFGNSFIRMRDEVKFCRECYNVSDSDVCAICTSHKRNRDTICIVEDMRDVIAIEHTHQYRGVYHVLGGIISPMDGIGPDDLTIEPLIDKVRAGNVKEVIFALSTTMEGDTTNFYIYRRLQDLPVEVSTIARGVAVGNELEYTDEITLGRSILNRTPYSGSLDIK